MTFGALLGVLFTVIAVPDPGTSAAGARVIIVPAGTVIPEASRSAVTDASGHAVFDVPPATYAVHVIKTGFVPGRATTRVPDGVPRVTVRIALHAVPTTALRAIGSVSAAQRGAFNTAPEPIAVLPREGYRDQGQAGPVAVLAQTPSIAVDRAARGLTAADDEPPVALVRGGTPMETQMLLEGVPIALATTRTLPLTAIPAFLLGEIEVHPGASAPLPVIDGGLNGTVNIRLPDPAPVSRALPEVGADGRGGSFADIAAGGGLADGRIGVALAAASSGATAFTPNGQSAYTAPYDTIQRAVALKARAALSPAATLTATTYDEADSNRYDDGAFAFTEGELRIGGARDTALARWWHASAVRNGPGAGDPFELVTADSLTGGSLEFDHAAGVAQYAAGVTETYGTGTALGLVDVVGDAHVRVQTAFARALAPLGRRLSGQLTVYDVHADAVADGFSLTESGIAARAGLAYAAGAGTSLRASFGSGFTPPSVVALAGLRGGTRGAEYANTADVGLDVRVFDAATTFAFDAFSTTEQNRVVEDARARWVDAGTVARRGAELSLARRPRVGLGYLLQAWTVSETPPLGFVLGDAASGATHGYAEISYHGAQGSRVSLGATYWGADGVLGQPSFVMLNTNVEIPLGARGKIQFDVENLNNAARAVPPLPFGPFGIPSPFAPGPRTARVFLRRSFGRTGTDG